MTYRGFTLIETMIVVAIIGILLIMGLPSLGDYVGNARLRGTAEQILDGLNTARMEGIRRNTTINFVPNNTGWTVVAPAIGTTAATTLATRTAMATEGRIVAAITAPTGGTLASFNGSGRLTSGSPFSMTVTQMGGTCVAAGGTVRCLNINAVAGGSIRMCDPAQASTKPEGC